MTTQQHPLTPPPELVKQWLGEYFGCTVNGELNDSERFLTTRAAQWGADQELDACCEWLPSDLTIDGECLRDVRRPKPPSLAEEALDYVTRLAAGEPVSRHAPELETIRRALERLQRLDGQQ